MNTRTAAQLMRASTLGGEEIFDKEIDGFSIDSRSVGRGELFFALSPEDYARHSFTADTFTDAHRFIPQAFERGALATVARRERVRGDAELEAYGERLLLVDDAIEALQLLARGVLDAWGRPVVAITGSAGKTTAKDLTAHLLAHHSGRRVLKTLKNFNNELGVPLSVLQMEEAGARPADYDLAVLEMGMSTPNEIARLCGIAPPDIAVVLMVAPVHLEFMGTIENIAVGKAQLVEGLKAGGTAVLNADDERVSAMRSKHSGRTLTFGIDRRADVMATVINDEHFGLTRFRLVTPHGECDAALPMPGRHNLMNALAAAAVASCFDIAPEDIARSLAVAAPSEMRGQVLHFAEGFTVVDDSYNSNPRSLLSMAQSLTASGESSTRRRIVIAGEMLELGEAGAALHRDAGGDIARMKVDVLWGVRGLGAEVVEGARAAGMSEAATRFFATTEEASDALVGEIRAGDLVLVKGSRGVHMEKVIAALRENFEMSVEH